MSDLAHAGTAKGQGGMAAWALPFSVQATAYRPDIDGLRALAVGAVVIGHLWPQLLPGGYVGVDVFFVISGYLITQILSRELAQGRFTLASFYGRRARRLFPALFTVLAASFAVGCVVLLPSDLTAMAQAMAATVMFGANVLFWRQSSGYFGATEALSNPLLHMWSLGVEEQFYLFFPWLLVAGFAWAALRGRRPQPVWRWGLLLLAALGLLLAGWMTARNSTAAFYLSPLRAWEFMVGALVALWPWPAKLAQGSVIAPSAVPKPVAAWRVAWLREALAASSVAVLLACMLTYSAHTRFPGWAALAPVLATAVLLHGGAANHAVAKLLSAPPLVGLGLVSYSLYLWHWPVLVLLRQQQGSWPGPWWGAWGLALALVLSLALAVLTWRFVEQPWRRPPALRPPHGLAWAMAVALGLVLVGGWTVVRQGFEGRVPAAVLAMDRVRQTADALQHCSDLPMAQACVLGLPSARPHVLLWGDSHLMSWSPALDQMLAKAGRSALLAVNLGCAPAMGLVNRQKKGCGAASQAVWAHLQAHPSIQVVLMTGHWSHYFKDEGPSMAMGSHGQPLQGAQAAQHALRSTVAQLLASGREVVLLGPVPTYTFNVPQTLALHAWQERAMPVLGAVEQASRHASFWRTFEAWGPVPGLKLVDVVPWFCKTDCALMAQGQTLYRDEQHLSAWGAFWAEPQLAQTLATTLGMAVPQPATSQP